MQILRKEVGRILLILYEAWPLALIGRALMQQF